MEGSFAIYVANFLSAQFNVSVDTMRFLSSAFVMKRGVLHALGVDRVEQQPCGDIELRFA